MNHNVINTYLYAGYIPRTKIPDWLPNCLKTEYKEGKFSVVEAASVFDKVFDRLVEQNTGGNHVIPLSGGWDSRAILGALLKRVERNQIKTVTFGVPGQLDYDLGIKVAKAASVTHHAIDLRAVIITWESLILTARRSPWSGIFDSMFNTLARNDVSTKTDTIWSGFIGDAITGGHFHGSHNQDNEHVFQHYLKNRKRIKTIDLCDVSFNLDQIIKRPIADERFNYYEMLLFGLHCTKSTTPINLPIKEWEKWDAFIGNEFNGAAVVAPFIDPVFSGYWLSAPVDLRIGQKLYIEILNYKFPGLFAMPVKKDFGLKQNKKSGIFFKKALYLARYKVHQKVPWLGIKSDLFRNYLDYDKMFRTRQDYKTVLTIALDYLKKNEITPWLDLDKLLREHMRYQKNHGDAFTVLIGLAANLEVNSFN